MGLMVELQVEPPRPRLKKNYCLMTIIQDSFLYIYGRKCKTWDLCNTMQKSRLSDLENKLVNLCLGTLINMMDDFANAVSNVPDSTSLSGTASQTALLVHLTTLLLDTLLPFQFSLHHFRCLQLLQKYGTIS